MSAKFTAQRKNAFLKYLSQSGNITLSAERAKVSRSWVCLHRAQDAGFDAACVAAIAAARERLAPGSTPPHPPAAGAAGPSLSREGRGSNRPPAGWRYFDGHELVVRGTGGSSGKGSGKRRRVQIGRARLKQWTPRVERRFLEALAATGNVHAACAEAGMWPPSAYNHRKRWERFAEAWDEAVAEGYLRLEGALALRGCNLFSARSLAELADGEDGEDSGAPPEVRIVAMTADHALAALNAYRRRLPPDCFSSEYQEEHAAMVAATDEKLRRKMAMLRLIDEEGRVIGQRDGEAEGNDGGVTLNPLSPR